MAPEIPLDQQRPAEYVFSAMSRRRWRGYASGKGQPQRARRAELARSRLRVARPAEQRGDLPRPAPTPAPNTRGKCRARRHFSREGRAAGGSARRVGDRAQHQRCRQPRRSSATRALARRSQCASARICPRWRGCRGPRAPGRTAPMRGASRPSRRGMAVGAPAPSSPIDVGGEAHVAVAADAAPARRSTPSGDGVRRGLDRRRCDGRRRRRCRPAARESRARASPGASGHCAHRTPPADDASAGAPVGGRGPPAIRSSIDAAAQPVAIAGIDACARRDAGSSRRRTTRAPRPRADDGLERRGRRRPTT